MPKPTVYQKILRAKAKATGLRLTSEEVNRLALHVAEWVLERPDVVCTGHNLTWGDRLIRLASASGYTPVGRLELRYDSVIDRWYLHDTTPDGPVIVSVGLAGRLTNDFSEDDALLAAERYYGIKE